MKVCTRAPPKPSFATDVYTYVIQLKIECFFSGTKCAKIGASLGRFKRSPEARLDLGGKLPVKTRGKERREK